MNKQRVLTDDCANRNFQQAWIVNLSGRKLTTTEETILRKGPKYKTTSKINIIDFAGRIDSALYYSIASEQAKKATRIKNYEVIRKAKKPQSNVYKEERQDNLTRRQQNEDS